MGLENLGRFDSFNALARFHQGRKVSRSFWLPRSFLMCKPSYFFSIAGTVVRIYSAVTGKVVSTLSSSATGSSVSRIANGEGHSDTVTAAILNPENAFQLITASLDGCIKVWNFLDAVLLETIHVGKPISHMCAHGRYAGSVFVAILTKMKKGRREERECCTESYEYVKLISLASSNE